MFNLSFLGSMQACRYFNYHTEMQGYYIARISSGLRILTAADDPAGLVISEKMRAQIRGLDMAVRNAQDTISLVQTAEGALNESHSILQRIRELSVQAGNDTLTPLERQAITEEVDQLLQGIDDIAHNTQFNTIKLLDGTFTNKHFQIGANSGQSMGLTIDAADKSTLGLNDLLAKLGTSEGASEAITIVDGAIEKVSSQRIRLGATQNRLEHTINNLTTSSENLTAAESRIRDADLAKMILEYTRHSILAQVAQAMIAQMKFQTERTVQLLLDSLKH
ncbi:flagellin [Heliobacterium chlorum]|uniref:Flagellin n=1 Tax=Heliobacterium chlorum TaxID=2698 RepID=A0ABR7T661_HELCL|nr:flagellin [Heliobacterium chlorum]MBC9786259.1 flagellin [Heliobacterium chlorum]